MRRHNEPDVQDHDSFLDIVANMVGILIILVLVVSIRAKDAPVQVPVPALPEIDLDTPQGTIGSLRQDLVRLANENRNMGDLLAVRQHERQAMATTLAAAEEEIAQRRESLDSRQKAEFDLRRKLAAARAKLDKVELERIHAAAVEPDVVEVESYPTPLSETVFGEEVHFQLRGGRVIHVPIDRLFEEAKAQAREKFWKVDKRLETTELVGPIGGFRMRYTLEKKELPVAVRLETGRTGFMIQAKRWELIPTNSQLGEPLADALADGSQFRRAIGTLDPKNATITIWTYPDSFDEFRRLKKELYHMGFPTASRPLPNGVPIAGSPDGSRSNAQ